jgi:hypothetical protein
MRTVSGEMVAGGRSDVAYATLPPVASQRRIAPTDSRVVIAFAISDAAGGAASTFNTSHAFSVAEVR